MRFAFTLFALTGLVRSQGIDFNVYQTAAPASVDGPSPTALTELPPNVYNATAVQSSVAAAVATAPVDSFNSAPSKFRVVRRDADCAPQSGGNGPAVHNPDTPEAFEQSPYLQASSLSASAPPGYTTAFRDLNGSTQLNTYMGLYTLSSYSPSQCASYCNQVSNCLGFNIYYERDPSLNPGAACPNPASQTNIKCTLYGSQVSAASATNTGQYRAQFHVVIAGSNGYNRIVLPAPVQKAYNNPAALAGAVNYSQGYIGSRFFNQPFDAGVCAALCSATTADNRAVAQAQYTGPGGSFDGSYQACNYFNAYILSANNVPKGVYCALYTAPVPSNAPTFTSSSGGGVQFGASFSYGFSASVQDDGTVAS